jgi:hypothetical protein
MTEAASNDSRQCRDAADDLQLDSPKVFETYYRCGSALAELPLPKSWPLAPLK